MNIDNLIDIEFDFDKLKSDCLIHDFLKTYIKKNRIYQASVKIRLNHPAVAETVYPHENEDAKILFDEPQEAVCPGQHAVFYREDTVLGGGVIQQAIGL